MRSTLATSLIGATLWLTALGAHAGFSVFNTAVLVPLDDGRISLDGFGRGTAENAAGGSFADGATTLVEPGREVFFDTWNVQPGVVQPGLYAFGNLTVDASGELQFDSVALHSYDLAGERNTIVFNVNDAGTQAVGSGRFTVLEDCPVAHCIWIDLIGTQPIGSVTNGYGGTTVAVAVPEPAVWSSMLLGLGGLQLLLRRRRDRAAS